jgi:hypothetical protein
MADAIIPLTAPDGNNAIENGSSIIVTSDNNNNNNNNTIPPSSSPNTTNATSTSSNGSGNSEVGVVSITPISLPMIESPTFVVNATATDNANGTIAIPPSSSPSSSLALTSNNGNGSPVNDMVSPVASSHPLSPSGDAVVVVGRHSLPEAFPIAPPSPRASANIASPIAIIAPSGSTSGATTTTTSPSSTQSPPSPLSASSTPGASPTSANSTPSGSPPIPLTLDASSAGTAASPTSDSSSPPGSPTSITSSTPATEMIVMEMDMDADLEAYAKRGRTQNLLDDLKKVVTNERPG